MEPKDDDDDPDHAVMSASSSNATGHYAGAESSGGALTKSMTMDGFDNDDNGDVDGQDSKIFGAGFRPVRGNLGSGGCRCEASTVNEAQDSAFQRVIDGMLRKESDDKP